MHSHNKCEYIITLLERYIDNELDSKDRLIVEQHLKECRSCSGKLDHLLETDGFIRSNLFPDPGPDFWRTQKKQILAALEPDLQKNNVKVLEHWPKRLIRNTGFKTAFGAVAAALLVFGILKQTDFTVTGTSRVREQLISENTKPSVEQDTKEAAQITQRRDNLAMQPPADSDPRSSNAPENKPETVIEKEPERTDWPKPAAETPPAIEDVQIPKNTEIDKIDVKVEVSGASAKNPINELGGITDFQNKALKIADTPAQHMFSAESNLYMPKEEAEEFDAYLLNKRIIDSIDNPFIQKNRWLSFLDLLEGETVINLVVNDIYDIYNKTISSESPPGLKSEALRFVKEHKDILLVRLGETRYRNAVKYLENIQEGL